MRNTPQRNAIIKVIENESRPLSVEEILSEGIKIVPSLGVATVYREIKRLQESGDITVVNLPGGGVMYEKSGISHHHHFKCESCGVVYDIPGCMEELQKNLPKGFRLTGHEVFLYGLCDRC